MRGERLVGGHWLYALSKQPRILWALAIAFYGVGDAVTTLIGIRTEDIAEVGPIALVAMDIAGDAGFLVMKALFIGACFTVWYVLDTPGRVAIPMALIVAGAGITVWNVVMLLL